MTIRCKICGRDMNKDNGCSLSSLYINKIKYTRIKVGDPDDLRSIPKGKRCPDCGAKYGYYHHYCCDGETCPKCHQQLLSCECEDVDMKNWTEILDYI